MSEGAIRVGEARTIFVAGASRGLGLGLVRAYLEAGWSVIATARAESGAALADLAASVGDRLRLAVLDVTDRAGIAALAEGLAGVTLDVLFVCAGMLSDRETKAADVGDEAFARMMLTNALAPLRLVEALGDHVASDGAIVAMTSVLGSVGDNTHGGVEIYRASKAALNTLLRSHAARHRERTLIAMHPGWVRTDMGGPRADVSVEASVQGMMEAIAARRGKPGCVFIDYRGRTIPW